MEWDTIIDGKLIAKDQPRPRTLGNISDPTPTELNAAGWYEQSKLSDPPEGQYVTGWTWAGLQGARSVYAPIYSLIPEVVEPTPERFPAGVDTSLLVLDTTDGKGVGYVAADDGSGDMVKVVYAHESPYDLPKMRAAIAAARAWHASTKLARTQARAQIATDAGKAQSAAGGANNINVLREQVAALARIVQELVEGGL